MGDFVVGATVGFFDGIMVGPLLGEVVEGPTEGIIDIVGIIEVVGDRVGLVVGLLLGDEEGLTLGTLEVGVRVGLKEG